jgi:hypothetical protein
MIWSHQTFALLAPFADKFRKMVEAKLLDTVRTRVEENTSTANTDAWNRTATNDPLDLVYVVQGDSNAISSEMISSSRKEAKQMLLLLDGLARTICRRC